MWLKTTTDLLDRDRGASSAILNSAKIASRIYCFFHAETTFLRVWLPAVRVPYAEVAVLDQGHLNDRRVAISLAWFVILIPILRGQEDPPAAHYATPGSTPLNKERILGVIPDYHTIRDPKTTVAPMTVRQKWQLFLKESVDPFTVAGALAGATISHAGQSVPEYGSDKEAYAERFGAALADVTTQNFFSDAILAPLLHEDPRYFRKGPESSIPKRIAYSLSRLVITRTDSGRTTFNFAGVIGTAMGIALSNAYYPDRDVNGSVVRGRCLSSFTGGAVSNLLPEFWPDVREKLHKLHRHSTNTP